jgi:CRISPR-associated protein Csd2
MSHTYHFPDLWNGKTHDAVVTERHDIVLLFDATNCNPNGDPDTGNMPRLQPDTLRGLVTDVCLKRKVRNFWGLYPPQPSGYGIFIKESAILGNVLQSSHDALIAKLCRQLIAELEANRFLAADVAKDLADSLTEINSPRDNKRPDSPEKCLAYVVNLCKGKFDCAPLVAKVFGTLSSSQGFPEESRSAIGSLSLKDEEKGDPAKAAKAIEKAALDAAPRGKKPVVKAALEAALEKTSPDSLLESRFAKIKMEEANRDALCATFADVRAFGAVVSTDGPLKGSFYGQIRGPLQITFAETLDKILQLDFTITRCAEASAPKAKKGDDEAAEAASESSDNRTMGRKHAVPYGLYRCHIHFSPAFAAKTSFTYADLDNFLFALTRCLGDYNVDIASARAGGMTVVGLVDFQHKDSLGNAPAHKLFEMVKVAGKKDSDGRFSSGSEFPGGLGDYAGMAPDGSIYVEKNKYEQVIACTDKKPAPKDGNEPIAAINAHRIIWKFPEPQ